MPKKILVRADGDSRLGIGHITRCMYFIKSIKENFEIIFIFKKNSQIKEFLISHNHKIQELKPNLSLHEEINILLNFSSDLLILDIRGKNDNYYSTYSENFKKVLRFDDSDKSINIYSNYYLNYNLYAEDIDFNMQNKNCELFLGPKYYILNPIYYKFKNYETKFNKKAKNILITMGGGDPKNLTKKITESLVKLKEIHLNVILGSLYERSDEIEELKKDYPNKISIFNNIKNMPDMMVKNDLIIGTGGNTSFEAAYMGIPGILINQITLQVLNAAKYEEKRIFRNSGLGEDLSEETIRKITMELMESEQIRREFSENGKNLLKSQKIKTVIEKFIN